MSSEADKPLPVAQAGQVPATVDTSRVDYGEDAGAGFENQTKDDIATPFIDILQSNSPEVTGAGRDGARGGDIINRATGEIWAGEEGVTFIPFWTEHCYTRWKVRKDPVSGALVPGGFVARHELDDPLSQRAKRDFEFKPMPLPDNQELLETFYLYALIVEDDQIGPACFAFGSTKIKAYKSFSQVARAIQVFTPDNRRQNPPLYAHRYRYATKLKTVGPNSWFIPVIKFDGKDAESCRYLPNDPLFQQAKSLKLSWQEGAGTRVDYTKTTIAETGAERQSAGKDGEDIPF